MTLEVLQTKEQIARARSALIAGGLSALDTPVMRMARRFGLKRGVAVGDLVKSWDVEATLSFLQSHVARDAAVADIGCFASEVPVSLHRAGYTRLTGIDLNPLIASMPFAGEIRYVVADFTATPLPAASFDAITAISVIEHGYDPERLLREVSRLLKHGGYFIASFDYWPDKIATEDTTFFGLPWLIFAREDVRHLLDVAARHGLAPLGDLRFDARDRTIECAQRNYTFAHLVLQKNAADGPA